MRHTCVSGWRAHASTRYLARPQLDPIDRFTLIALRDGLNDKDMANVERNRCSANYSCNEGLLCWVVGNERLICVCDTSFDDWQKNK